MTGCRPRRRATPWMGCCAATTLSVQQRLAREKDQDQEQAENRVLEDQPGDPQPATLTGEKPGEHGGAQRQGHGQPKDADDDDQLAELGSETRDAGGRFLGTLEADRLEGRAGDRCAQQLIVEGVTRLVGAEGAQQGPPEQVQVAHRV
jgi:hypothetical protein